jgi:hypothetical protein
VSLALFLAPNIGPVGDAETFTGREYGSSGANVPSRRGLGGRVGVTAPFATFCIRPDGGIAIRAIWPAGTSEISASRIARVVRLAGSARRLRPGGVAVQRDDGEWFYFWCGDEAAQEIVAMLSWLGAPVDQNVGEIRLYNPVTGPRPPA